jgi:class 3 adenylate cyclase/tetratricopeptide (TPR) repeat protein
MTFEELLDQALALLQRRGRVTYRALKRQFHLDDDAFEDLKDELLYAHPHVVNDDGRGLVWTGEARPTSTPGSPPAVDQARAPLAYTPPYLAEKILTSKAVLEGERKQVTVLFADLKGSMELLADRDPEEARQLLDPVLERMMAAVHRFEGTVNQVMGDGIMALFGAPIAHEDHAVRACYAALAMQESIRHYSAEVRHSHGVEVQVRVGLNSGEVVVRSIGNDLHMDYSAIGQTTHLAARMEQLATPGSIRLTAETLRLAEGFVQVNALGPVPVKGVTEPVEVFNLTGATGVRRRLQATAARGLTQFVGRQTEINLLRQALARAGAGHGQVVAVIGEPGLGKSRLIWEFTHSPQLQGWLLLESSSVSYGKATPYLPVIDLLKAYCKIQDRDEQQEIREKVTGKVLTLDRALEPTLPAFLALLDVSVEDPQWHALEPPQQRQRTLDALKRLLLRESQVQPLLVVFEDLHWIDAETQALLDSLIESLPTARLLLLVNYRPEYQHGWGSKTYYTQLRLDPLPPASAEALLQSLLGDDASRDLLKQRLIKRTQGNPFFLEESVRTLVEMQVLVGERGAYHVAKPLPSIQVPATVQAVLAGRIDRLPPEEKRLLQTAAVIGTEVPLTLLQAIAELPEDALHGSLARLQSTEFLYETRLFPDHAYTFKHALTHEVAYSSLLQERRRALHARIVEALETLAGDRLAEQVERLANHALRGEVWDKALAYGRQAGAKALARSAHHEAVAHFEQGLVALTHLPESVDTIAQAIDLRLDMRQALLPLAEHGRILDHLRHAECLAEALDDRRRLGLIAVYMASCLGHLGDAAGGLASAQRALAMATALGDVGLQVAANTQLGEVYLWDLSDYRRAAEVLRRNVEALHDVPLAERFGGAMVKSVHARAYLAECLAELGAFAEGRRHGEDALRIAEAVDHPYSLAQACQAVGQLYLHQGALPQAIRVLERGLSLSEALQFPEASRPCRARLGRAYALSGRMAEALPLLERVFEQGGVMRLTGAHSVWLGEGYVLAGRVEEALRLGQRVLEAARAQQQPGDRAYALRLLGEIAAQRGPPEVAQAEHHYRQAMALAIELGMRPLLAHCHLGLGTLYAKNGQREQARAELSTAIELYRAMEMTFWLPQAEAALARVEER